MKKVMVIFGTRPEAIKMCPVIYELRKRSEIETIVCVTGQHKEMLNQVLDIFKIVPKYNLSIMQDKQDLFDISITILQRLREILIQENPDVVLVHGDTSTTFITALACYYLKIKVGHVEAGLRTYDLYSPFPEEFNRQGVGIIAKYHFAPTDEARQNLLKEGKDENDIFVTGNTVIDALKYTVIDNFTHPEIEWVGDSRMVLLTAHRRENISSLQKIFKGIRRVLDEFEDVKLIYPVHLNPVIREIAREEFGDCNRIHIIDPLDVVTFHNFMAKAYLILTDSGGIQEEAPSLGKPVLVMRDTTERPEGVKAGTLKLIGTQENKIYESFKNLLSDETEYIAMAKSINPYGDGVASKRIVDIICNR